MVMALIIYVLGMCSVFFPKRFEYSAHVTGMSLAALASLLVFVMSADVLLGWGMLLPAGTSFGEPTGWGMFSLQEDFWSAAFLALTGFSGMAVSIYGIGYGKAYQGQRLRMLTGIWNLFVLLRFYGRIFAFTFQFRRNLVV